MGNGSSPLVSIVIVSYNVKTLLCTCLNSLKNHFSFPAEIIVVDNASTDGTQETLKIEFPEIHLIENRINLGFSAANNIGFNVAKSDYIFMLNPDTEVKNDSFKAMLEFTKNNKDSIVGPRLLNTDGTPQTSVWHYPTLIHHVVELFFLSGVFNLSLYSPRCSLKNSDVDFLSGAAILIEKNTIQKLNGLDENLFWMDDVDLCYRNKLNGGKNIYFPGCTIIHHSGQSGKKNYNVVISNQVISKLKYYKKHRQYLNFYFSIPIFFLQIITRIPLFLVLAPFKQEFFKKGIAYSYTFKKFFRYLFLNDQSVT